MLNVSVLVLNKSWVAVHITPARRALTLLYLGAARAVHPVDYSLYAFEDWLELSQDGLGGRYIHSPTTRIRLPEVIQLNQFNGFVRHEARLSRLSILERDRHQCQYCGRVMPRSRLTIDHVIPQSRGGVETWDNLVTACMPCNVRKGNRTPEEAQMPLLRDPRRPSWLPRFGTRIPDDQLRVWRRFVVDGSAWHLPHVDDALDLGGLSMPLSAVE